MLSLLAKSALYRPRIDETIDQVKLPDLAKRQSIIINGPHCERYNRLCEWQPGIASVVHPNYIQVLSLPMQLSMMVEVPFPFKPLGLVHISNQIEVNALCEQHSTLEMQTSFGKLMWHKKGWVFEVITKAFQDQRLMITATSSYLARTKHSGDVAHSDSEKNHVSHYHDAKVKLTNAELSLEPNYKLLYQPCTFESNIGRKYAAISKDYNPIHLTTASARMLGFKQAIAHGMFSKALCVSHLFKRIPRLKSQVLGSFDVYTEFMQPIYLPSKSTLVANLAEQKSDDAQPHQQEHLYSFRLASFKNGKTREFLRGEVKPT